MRARDGQQGEPAAGHTLELTGLATFSFLVVMKPLFRPKAIPVLAIMSVRQEEKGEAAVGPAVDSGRAGFLTGRDSFCIPPPFSHEKCIPPPICGPLHFSHHPEKCNVAFG